jgi:hypothetical protein
MPEFADAKPKAYNGENTSNGSEKNAAIALYNNEAAKIITEYERFLNFHYKVDTTVYAVTAIPGGYEIVIDDFTMLDGGDFIEISGTKYKVDSIDTGVVTVLTTDTLYADSECVYYPFSKFINHNIKAIV